MRRPWSVINRMTWQYSPYSSFLFLSAIGQLFLAIFVRQQQRNRTRDYLTLLLFSTSWWTICYGLELVSVGIEAKRFWDGVGLLGAAGLVVVWPLLVVSYIGRYEWVTPWRVIAASLVPAAFVALAWTNEQHLLVWSRSAVTPDGLFLTTRPGPAYWVFIATAYWYFAVSAVSLVRTIWRSVSAPFRWQAIAMLLTLLLPWTAHGIGLAGLGPSPYLDLAPFSFVFSSVFLYLGLKRYFLLDITPLAQSDVINSLEDGVIVIDRKGRILNLNQGAIEILPAGTGRLIGHDLPAALRTQLELPPPLDDKAPYTTEVGFQHGEETHHYQLRLYLFDDRDRQQCGYLIILNDITEWKQLQQMREDLAQAVVHDLRSPISNLALTLDWLADKTYDRLTADETDLVEAAQHTADKLLLLVSSILDLERLEVGQMPLNRTPTALAPVIHEALSEQAVAAQMKRQTMTADLPTGLPHVDADPELISRVLQNLLGNAVKFTPSGGHIRVSAIQIPGKVEIAVHDSGPGIEPEAAHHLFEKFRPGHRDGRGSGLGLAFCKRAIEAHGEKIWVESKLDAGTRITFTLTALYDQSPSEAQPAPLVSAV